MRRIDHVILYVQDLERSVAFYRDVLGFEVKLEGDGYVEFVTEAGKFGLLERSMLSGLIGPTPAPAGPQGEILFLVEDADAEADRLQRAGVEILSGPQDRPWGHRTVHLLDPDGFVIELAQEIPREKGPPGP